MAVPATVAAAVEATVRAQHDRGDTEVSITQLALRKGLDQLTMLEVGRDLDAFGDLFGGLSVTRYASNRYLSAHLSAEASRELSARAPTCLS